MNMLIVGNGHTTKIDSKYYKDKFSGGFLEEITTYCTKSVWLEPVSEASNTNQDLHNKLLNFDKFNILITKEYKSKCFSLVMYIMKLLSAIKYSDVIYIYIPGKYAFVSTIICYLIGKSYALYIRGDMNFNSIIYQKLIKKSKFILTVGPSFKDRIFLYNKNVYLVSTMLDISKNDIIDNKIIVPKDIVNILFVGRLEKAKGIYDLLDALVEINKLNIDYRIDVIGGGVEIDNINIHVKNNRLRNNVIIHGLINNKEVLSEFYKKTDIFVMPSHHEGFPRVLYEAMTYGASILTTFVGSIDSTMKDEYNCLEIKSKNYNSIKDKLIQIINDIELRQHISSNARETMLSFFEQKSKYTHAQQVIRLFEDKAI